MLQEGNEVFVPETYIRPSQFSRRRAVVPESLTKLAFALIIGGLEDLEFRGLICGRRASRARMAIEARLWFLSNSESAGSFRWACSILNLDPHVMRRRLR